jgi:serine/threonine-protein kinase
VVCPRCYRENKEDSRYCASCGSTLRDESPAGGTLTLFSPPDEFATGSFFADRYRIIEEIGHGGMGNVYKAFDTKVREKIALKIIRPEIARDGTTVERFRNELKLARQITHPHVCRVFDLGESGGMPFLTMEFVPGENLALMLRMAGPLPPETAVAYARQIAQGLSAAHRLGVIHRDLKPHNILIDESGTAKIMDFGIARSVLAGTSADDGKIMGTPDYMAPEQAAGNPADARADLYALGVILYEMVTGRRPFSGDTPRDVATKHRTEAPRPPLELNSRVPAGLNDVILKSLAKDPAGRYQTADELFEALDALAPLLSPPTESQGAPRLRFRPVAMFRKAAPWILLLLLGAALFFKWPAAKGPLEGPPLGSEAENRLAVLPLQDRSTGGEREVFGDSLTSGIRSRLDAADIIKMISKMSCDQVRNTKDGLRAVGRKLQARHILYGSFAVENDRLRIFMFLGDAVNDIETWNANYDEPLASLFDIENRIAADIAGRLKVRLSPQRLEGAQKRDPINIEALKSYLEGERAQADFRLLWQDRDYARSVRAYNQAARLDPSYALPFVGLGNLEEGVYARTDGSESQKALARMRGWFQKATDLDPNLAEAAVGLGWAYLYENNDVEAARFMRQGLTRAPENAEVNYGVGAFLKTIGLFELSVPHFQKAAVLDRLNPQPTYMAANSLWALGRIDESLAALSAITSFEGDKSRYHQSQARIFIMRRDWDAAELALAAAEKGVPPNNAAAAASVKRQRAWFAAARGQKGTALALLKDEPQPFRYEVTNAYCLLGEKAAALRLMELGYRTGFAAIKDYMYGYEYLVWNPILKVLEGEAQYQELLKKARADYDRWTKLCAGL